MSVSRAHALAVNESCWDHIAQKFYGSTALPEYGPLCDTEEQLGLLGDLRGAAVLELGCGSGHTLRYLRDTKDVGELWGLDLSGRQIELAQEVLGNHAVIPHLFKGPMDENPGLPEEHFDLVLSIYALGWCPNIARTTALVRRYLKPGGRFLFSWEHPIYRLVEYDPGSGHHFLSKSYHEEGPTPTSFLSNEAVFHPRQLSTYLNAVADAGLMVERIIETHPNLSSARPKDHQPGGYYSVPKTSLVPSTMIVRACRLDDHPRVSSKDSIGLP